MARARKFKGKAKAKKFRLMMLPRQPGRAAYYDVLDMNGRFFCEGDAIAEMFPFIKKIKQNPDNDLVIKVSVKVLKRVPGSGPTEE